MLFLPKNLITDINQCIHPGHASKSSTGKLLNLIRVWERHVEGTCCAILWSPWLVILNPSDLLIIIGSNLGFFSQSAVLRLVHLLCAASQVFVPGNMQYRRHGCKPEAASVCRAKYPISLCSKVSINELLVDYTGPVSAEQLQNALDALVAASQDYEAGNQALHPLDSLKWRLRRISWRSASHRCFLYMYEYRFLVCSKQLSLS